MPQRLRFFCLCLVGLFFILGSGVPRAKSASIWADVVFPDNPVISGKNPGSFDGDYGPIAWSVIQSSADVNFKIRDGSRAFNGFHLGRYHCLFPDAQEFYDPRKNFVETSSLAESVWYIITRVDSELLNRKSQLLGRDVVVPFPPSALYQVIPQEGVYYRVVDEFEAVLLMTLKGGADAAVLPGQPLGALMADLELVGRLQFSEDNPMAKVEIGFLFHDTPRGREIRDKLEAVIQGISPETLRSMIRQ